MIKALTKKIEYMASKNKIVYKLSSLYYKNIVKNEAKLADINQNDNVLFIGGGPCPFSAILLHKYTGAKITIIDNDCGCINCAKKAVKKAGYEDNIKILHADGEDFLPNQFTAVFIAAQVSPVEKVFNYVKCACKKGVKILVRLPKQSIEKLYNNIDRNIFALCPRTTHAKSKNLECTVLYVS